MDARSENTGDEIQSKVSLLYDERYKLIGQLKYLNGKRRDLKQEVRTLSEKIREGKVHLSSYYDGISEFIDKRRKILANIREVRAKIDPIKNGLRDLKKQTAEKGLRKQAAEKGPMKQIDEPVEGLEERLEAIEWKLATVRVTREEEKEMITQVRNLEIKLLVGKRVSDQVKELDKLGREARSLKTNLEELDVFRAEVSPQMSAENERLTLYFRDRERVLAELDDSANEMMQLEERLQIVDEEIATNRALLKRDLELKRAKEKADAIAQEKELSQKLKASASEKLARGKKLTFDEFRVTLGDDDGDDGESLK